MQQLTATSHVTTLHCTYHAEVWMRIAAQYVAMLLVGYMALSLFFVN